MCIFGLIKRKKKGFLSSVSFVCWFFWFIGNLIIRRRRWRRKRKKIVQLTVKTQTHSHFFYIYTHIYTHTYNSHAHTHIYRHQDTPLVVNSYMYRYFCHFFLIFVNQLFSCFYFFNTKTTTKINFLCLRSSNYFFFLFFFVKFLFFFLSGSFSLLLWLVKVVSE